MIDGTHTMSGKFLNASMTVLLQDLYLSDRHLLAFEAASLSLADRPGKSAAERRHTALHVLYYRHSRTAHDVPAMLAEIEAMRKLGRTERWQTALNTYAEMITTNPYDDLDWVLAQYTTYSGHAAD